MKKEGGVQILKLNRKIHKIIRFTMYMLFMLPLLLSSLLPAVGQAENSKKIVYVVPVEATIERGLHAFMARAFEEAENNFADHIILDINTPGGAVHAAGEIGELLQKTQIPITAFVNPNATSAGAFIALNADQIVMNPNGGSMGSATVIDMEGNAGDAKVMAHWITKMTGAAKANGRDPLYAEAMVDPAIEIEGLTTNERPLDFRTDQALEYGYAEGTASNLEELLEFLELSGAQVVNMEISAAEHLARFITHPVVVSILFSLASLGIILELYSPGFGIPGMIGVSALVLFFFGHMVAGLAGWESLILFVVGVVLIAIEIFIPGFGVFGTLGAAAVIGSLALGSINIVVGLKSIGIAIVVTIIALIILGKSLNKTGFWSKLILEEDVSSEEGKVAFQKKSELVGQTGITVTKLRPSGTAKINGVRYDVVSDGGFIDILQPVKIIAVEGARIVVTQLDDE